MSASGWECGQKALRNCLSPLGTHTPAGAGEVAPRHLALVIGQGQQVEQPIWFP